MQNFRGARASAREALRHFRWFEYRPFAWIMGAQLLFLLLASNLGTAWGMAGAGWLMRLTREAGVHYPSSFIVLPLAFAYFESIVFVTVGSFLVPLSLVRIQAPLDRSPATGPPALARVRAAVPATMCSLLLNVAVLLGWQWIFPLGPSRWIHYFLQGLAGDFVSWLASVLTSLALATAFVYVPVRAVSGGSGFSDALAGGIREGLRFLGPTLFVILVFVWPTLIFLAPVQLRPTTIVGKFRPELIAVLIGIAAILNSFVNYLIYSAVARLHRLGSRKEAL